LPLLKRWAISASATNRPNVGNCCLDNLRFKIFFRVRTKVTEQSLIIKLGILSRPTDLGGRRCSTAVQTSETRTVEEDEKSQCRTYEEITVDKDRYKFTGSFIFYICSSVHRNSRLKKSNKMQQYADIYLLLNYSTCFGRPPRPSSVHKIVFAASGTDHTIYTLVQTILSGELATTVLCTPDDGCDGRPKHVE